MPPWASPPSGSSTKYLLAPDDPTLGRPIPFSPQHLEPAPPRPADPSAIHEFRLRVIAPEGLTEDEVKRLMDQLAADFGGAVVGRNASLESISRTRPRPSADDPSIRVVPKDEGGGSIASS